MKGQHSSCRPQMEASPLQKPPEQTEASERQDFPGQEHLFCPPSAFLPDLLTPILSVRSVVLLGLCQQGLSSSRQQEAEGPPRRSRGRRLHPSLYRQMWVAMALLGLHCSDGGETVSTLPLSIFCTTWNIATDL